MSGTHFHVTVPAGPWAPHCRNPFSAAELCSTSSPELISNFGFRRALGHMICGTHFLFSAHSRHSCPELIFKIHVRDGCPELISATSCGNSFPELIFGTHSRNPFFKENGFRNQFPEPIFQKRWVPELIPVTNFSREIGSENRGPKCAGTHFRGLIFQTD